MIVACLKWVAHPGEPHDERFAGASPADQAALELASRYEAMGGGVPDELARLAEAVDGQLLAARYEDLELDEAQRTQAELGPLLNAIVVDDLARALKVVIEETRAPGGAREVWLLEAGAPPPPELSAAPVPAVPLLSPVVAAVA